MHNSIFTAVINFDWLQLSRSWTKAEPNFPNRLVIVHMDLVFWPLGLLVFPKCPMSLKYFFTISKMQKFSFHIKWKTKPLYQMHVMDWLICGFLAFLICAVQMNLMQWRKQSQASKTCRWIGMTKLPQGVNKNKHPTQGVFMTVEHQRGMLFVILL